MREAAGIELAILDQPGGEPGECRLAREVRQQPRMMRLAVRVRTIFHDKKDQFACQSVDRMSRAAASAQLASVAACVLPGTSSALRKMPAPRLSSSTIKGRSLRSTAVMSALRSVAGSTASMSASCRYWPAWNFPLEID